MTIDVRFSGMDLSPLGRFPVLSQGFSSATANTNALQKDLDQRGVIFLLQPGTYYINRTLVISSKTHLILGPETVVKLAPGTSRTMLQNYAFANRERLRKTVTSLTYSAGAVTAACANHGYKTGDYVAVITEIGTEDPVYGGVWRVASVPNANSFTYHVTREPAAIVNARVSARDTLAIQFMDATGSGVNPGAETYRVLVFRT